MDSRFVPVIWTEDKIPFEAESYLECEVCTAKSRIIWGEGNPKAPIIIILDNPGARENKDGQDYVCGTRATLQLALNQINLSADNVYITYLLKCRPQGSYNKEKARSFSKPFLEKQIEAIQPRFIVCLGDVVVQWMFDNKDAHVKDLRGKWHVMMGFSTMVSYHPLAVRRRPNLMKQFMEDFEMLSQRLIGDI
ncbi:uracil-DNA glycosylase [Candidatus Clostridium stratigraminis]|uniref:Uracil-DNA glycosylase n=1 Tax=Candidatus Clostridium stratigraminis TaxID=3381661 RepID=A0ABW8T5M1_9CLOT